MLFVLLRIALIVLFAGAIVAAWMLIDYVTGLQVKLSVRERELRKACLDNINLNRYCQTLLKSIRPKRGKKPAKRAKKAKKASR